MPIYVKKEELADRVTDAVDAFINFLPDASMTITQFLNSKEHKDKLADKRTSYSENEFCWTSHYEGLRFERLQAAAEMLIDSVMRDVRLNATSTAAVNVFLREVRHPLHCVATRSPKTYDRAEIEKIIRAGLAKVEEVAPGIKSEPHFKLMHKRKWAYREEAAQRRELATRQLQIFKTQPKEDFCPIKWLNLYENIKERQAA